MSYYLDWPEEFNDTPAQFTLRPRTKNGYPQDFTLSVAVRDGQAVFTATALSFWEQRDGRPYDREPIARGYVDVAAYESCEDYAGNSAAPALIGWDIADLYPARMALIRALCEGIASSITMGTQILADGQVQVDHKDGGSARPTRKRDQHRRRHGPRPHHRAGPCAQRRIYQHRYRYLRACRPADARLLRQRAFPRSRRVRQPCLVHSEDAELLPVPAHAP